MYINIPAQDRLTAKKARKKAPLSGRSFSVYFVLEERKRGCIGFPLHDYKIDHEDFQTMKNK
jgi:hypothetical protein